MDNIQRAYPCHNPWWFHTTASRLIVQPLCTLRTTCFQTWMETHRLPRWHCLGVCTWLEETYQLALRNDVNLLNADFPIRRLLQELVLLFWWHLRPHTGDSSVFLFPLDPCLLLSSCSSVSSGTTLAPLLFCCLWQQVFIFALASWK